MSNTKLTKEQKQERKVMKSWLPEGSEFGYNPHAGVTVLVVPAGCVDIVFTSVASNRETKLRRKVGEYHALCRWDEQSSGGYLPGFILPSGVWTAQQLADIL